MRMRSWGMKLFMVGFSFFMLVGGIAFFHELQYNKEVNADTASNPHLNADGTVMHGTSPSSALNEYKGVHYPDWNFTFGSYNGQKLQWRLIWDYGDGTGIIFMYQPYKFHSLGLEWNSSCQYTGTCKKDDFFGGEAYKFLYGVNDDGTAMKTGGNSGFVADWKNSLNDPNNSDLLGQKIIRANPNMGVPFIMNYSPLGSDKPIVEDWAGKRENNIDTGHVGAGDFMANNTNYDTFVMTYDESGFDFTNSGQTTLKRSFMMSIDSDTGGGSRFICLSYTGRANCALTPSELSNDYGKVTTFPLAVYINIPKENIDSISYTAIETNFKEGEASTNKNSAIGTISTIGGSGPFSITIDSVNATASSSDMDQDGNSLNGTEPLSYQEFTLTNIDTVNGTAQLEIGNNSLSAGTYYVKVLVKDETTESGIYSSEIDDPDRTKSIVIKIEVLPLDFIPAFTPTEGLSIEYGNLNMNDKLGDLSNKNKNGDITALTQFQFVHSNNTLSSTSEDMAIQINNTSIYVNDISKLSASQHDYKVRGTVAGSSQDLTFTLEIKKKLISITTLLNNNDTSSTPLTIIKNSSGYTPSISSVTLPYSETLGTPTFVYKNSSGVIVSAPETIVDTYTLEVNGYTGGSADLNNYTITYTNSKLNVIDEALTSFAFTPTNSSYTYGDSEISSGGTVGSFVSTLTSGTSASYALCDDASCLTSTNDNGTLQISGNDLKVDAGKSVSAGTHNLYIKVSTSAGFSEIKPISFTVTPFQLTIKTLIGGNDYSTTAKQIYQNDTTYGISSYQCDQTLPNSETLGTATLAYLDSLGASSATPESTIGDYTLDVTFMNGTADLTTNYVVTYHKSKLSVQADQLNSFAFTETSASYMYGDSDVSSGGTVGSFTSTFTSGTNASYQICDDATCANPVTNNGTLQINGDDLKVVSGKQLNAGTYSHSIKVSTTTGISEIKTISFTIAPFDVEVKTLIQGADCSDTPKGIILGDTSYGSSSYKTNVPLPYGESFGNATFVYKNSLGQSMTNPETIKDVYTLEINGFTSGTADIDNNYNISYVYSKLNVNDDSLNNFMFTPANVHLVYGDSETMSGGVVGTLSSALSSGKVPIYQFCESMTTCATPSNVDPDGILEISGNDIKVRSGKQLDAKSYARKIQISNGLTFTQVQSISFDVAQKQLTISIVPSSLSALQKKVGENISDTNRFPVSASDYTITGLVGSDSLDTSSVSYAYASGFDSMMTSIQIHIDGLANPTGKNNYSFAYVDAPCNVTQTTILKDTHYQINGTLGILPWYQSSVTIAILPGFGYDEFIDAHGASLGSTITLDTSKAQDQRYVQLHNSDTGEITTSVTETIDLDFTLPEFQLTATTDHGGNVYPSGTSVAKDIHVELSQADANVSGITYYYTTQKVDANTTDPVSAPSKWTSLGNNTGMDFTMPEKTIYYFKAVSGSGLASITKQEIEIWNSSTLPNPVTLKWADASDLTLTYGNTPSSLAIVGDPNHYPITYTFQDDTGVIQPNDCISLDTSTTPAMVKAMNGTCANANIEIIATVGPYATPLTKKINIQKADLTLEARYADGKGGTANTISILTGDSEPTRSILATTLVGAETALSADDLGTYQYTYQKSGESVTSTTLDTTQKGAYHVTPSFASMKLANLTDKYNITWKQATITISDVMIDASDLYDITGTLGLVAWYTSLPVKIHPKHSVYNRLSVNGASATTSDYSYTSDGVYQNEIYTFYDDAGHSIDKSETIKIDTQIPELEVEAISNGTAYVSNTFSEYDVEIKSVKQPAGSENISGVSVYYTTVASAKDHDPTVDTVNWTQINGAFSAIDQKTTYYFKAVSGAGLVGDPVEFVADVHKPNLMEVPTIHVTSEGTNYQGGWTKGDITFALTSSVDQATYEVCVTNTNEETGCTWSLINDPENASHIVNSASFEQLYYFFRIHHDTYTYQSSEAIVASLDNLKPDQPQIVVSQSNTDPVSKLIRALSFGKWKKEETIITITSDDPKQNQVASGLDHISYDITQDGVTTTHPYTEPIHVNGEAEYTISAIAYDKAGNASIPSEEQEIFVDTIAPVINTIEHEETYHLPFVYIAFDDTRSGINEAATTYQNDGTTNALVNDTLFQGKGKVTLHLQDQAGNVTERTFTLAGLPEIEGCGSEQQALIETVKQQYETLKEVMKQAGKTLTLEQKQEIETWLKNASGSCKVENPDHHVIIESKEETIPEHTVLVVDVVTAQVDDLTLKGLGEEEEVKEAYDVYFRNGETTFKELAGSSNMTVRLPLGAYRNATGLRVVEINEDGTVSNIVNLTYTDDYAVFETTVLKKYAIVAKKDTIEDPMLDQDSNQDGKPDVNVDVDCDGEADINIDTDEDGFPDINIDTTGDGKPNYNIDIDGDGKADINIGPIHRPWTPDTCHMGTCKEYCTDSYYKPYLNIDTDEDGRPDINLDLYGDSEGSAPDGEPDINVDIDGDGIPDINIDTTGDGKADINIDENGDGKADRNLLKLTKWQPDRNVDGVILYDTMANLVPDEHLNDPNDPSVNTDPSKNQNTETSVKGTYESQGTGGSNTGEEITKGITLWILLLITSCSTILMQLTRRKMKKSSR